MIRNQRTLWLSIMLVTGFCSLVYELALAQLLTALLGNAMARFATTLGVYVVGLGIGSVSFKTRSREGDVRTFLRAELGLYALGLSSPFLFILFHRLALSMTQDPSAQIQILLALTHAVIFATGFCSGRELPVLSSLVTKDSKDAESEVLSADYIGMFIGSLAFPFILYPFVGLVPTFFLTAGLNLLAAIWTYLRVGQRTHLVSGLILTFACINIAGLIFASNIQAWLSVLYSTNS